MFISYHGYLHFESQDSPSIVQTAGVNQGVYSICDGLALLHGLYLGTVTLCSFLSIFPLLVKAWVYTIEKANDFVFISHMVENGLLDIKLEDFVSREVDSSKETPALSYDPFICVFDRRPGHNTKDQSPWHIFVHLKCSKIEYLSLYYQHNVVVKISKLRPYYEDISLEPEANTNFYYWQHIHYDWHLKRILEKFKWELEEIYIRLFYLKYKCEEFDHPHPPLIVAPRRNCQLQPWTRFKTIKVLVAYVAKQSRKCKQVEEKYANFAAKVTKKLDFAILNDLESSLDVDF
ncbi:putative esterase/lipase 2 [Spatholobus suberectus]|nr:putative esterase/lipase 2 [Spatholobus suberectus]